MTLPGFHECPEDCQDGWQDCGTGMYEHRCPECGGAGQVPDDDTVEVVAEAWKQARNSPIVNLAAARAALLAYARHVQQPSNL